MVTKKTNKVNKPTDLKGRIVDEAILMAEEENWESVRLRRVAERLGIMLLDLHAHYRDLDAVADDWFARANAAMIKPRGRKFTALPPRQRLRDLMQG